MDFVTSIIHIVSLLWDPIARRVRYITKLHETVGLLRTAKEDLIDARSQVERNIGVAERRGLTPADKVRRWLQRVEATEVEVNEIESAFNQRTRCLGDYHPNCWSSYKLGKKVVRKLAYVSELKSQGVFSHVAEESLLPDPVTEMPSTSTVGMDPTMRKVLHHLEEDEVGVIGVFGMGGVGKTTLLKKINNGFLQRSHDFDVVIWVVVSKEQNVKNIQKVVGNKLCLTLPEDQDEAAQRIFNVLRRTRFVLFLDDVWSRLDLEKVGIPQPNSQNKCKLIFSTRSEAVCGYMKARKKIKVECLAQQEAWDLFLDNVSEETMNSHPDIPTFAEIVAQKCGGLPLALITVGRAMASKKTPQEWKHAITVLGKSTSYFPGMEDEVLPLLKFSYDSLRGDTVKLCFLYCSLYPEDFSVFKNDLIDQWIGEGFLDECDDHDEALNKGCDVIGILKGACLLEGGEYGGDDRVKMHDIIRELALWIASECGERKDNFIVQAGTGLTNAPILEKCKETMRISLMYNELEELNGTPSCPNLITLMLQGNKRLSMISNNFFQFMRHLNVLDLSLTNLKELPTAIGELLELQYLNLSYTHIVALPPELVNLVKLKFLSLIFTPNLKRIPHYLISGLSRLQVLNLIGSNYNRYWKVEDSKDNESGADLLAQLEGLKQLNDLSIDIHNVHALNRFLSSQIFTKCIRDLQINKCNAFTCLQLSSTLRNMKRLQNLLIRDCHELEELIIDAEVDGTNWSLPSLERLFLITLDKLKTISVPPLQNLRNVFINNCNELKNITWVLHLHSRLEVIYLKDCKGIEEVIGDEVKETSQDLIAFPRLNLIYLESLPKLESICKHALAFHSLLTLEVRHCPKLKKLPFDPDNANNTLRAITGKEEWWDGLEWEDESLKSAFLPYFKPIPSDDCAADYLARNL